MDDLTFQTSGNICAGLGNGDSMDDMRSRKAKYQQYASRNMFEKQGFIIRIVGISAIVQYMMWTIYLVFPASLTNRSMVAQYAPLVSILAIQTTMMAPCFLGS